MKTQQQRIIEYLKDTDENGNPNTITLAKSLLELGIADFFARKAELKDKGYIFGKRRISKENRYGDTISYCEYWLIYDPIDGYRNEGGY